MSKFGRFLAASALAGACATSAMAENSFDYAFQGSLKGLDPYTLRETFTLGILTNVYEGLIKRGPNLEILPGLATSWEVIEPTRWRFHLRKGVKFHNGNDFTAEDVVFSAERLNSEGSDMKGRVPVDATFE
ncbi:ABC transporter substrate-binding protein, partial [Planktotalea sp.]